MLIHCCVFFTVFQPSVIPFVQPSVHSHCINLANGICSETTSTMVLKFHMQLNQNVGFWNDKFQSGQETKMASVTKYSRNNKMNFFSRNNWYIILLKIC